MPSSGFQTCADRKSTRLNSSHTIISYAVFCLKKKSDCTSWVDTDQFPNGLVTFRINPADPPQPSPPGASPRRPPPPSLHPAPAIFFFNVTATTEISPLSLPDALPI